MEEKKPKLFDRFVLLMEQNVRGIQIAVYSVAVTGLVFAIRSVRPFTRFKKPSDIPNGFILSGTKLKGTVDHIEPACSLLMVKHKPLVSIFKVNSPPLPVKIAGVHVSNLGVNWLQTIVVGNEVSFIPLHKTKEYVQCEVKMLQANKKKKLCDINIGPTLISIGFAQIAPIDGSLAKDASYQRYYKLLKASELAALRKKEGLWYYMRPTKEYTVKFWRHLYSTVRQRVLPSRSPRSVL